eukprot:TRINITY_DN15977_c0_g1_i1.p1 TRINITY_DN15977_c0_g1~~TRINITY_DN15977_c0_g1_i1.p1  ORF type:complete len:126 (+),score=31.16 TRINITY_DN15977_c0_g1_i1:20-397(+)
MSFEKVSESFLEHYYKLFCSDKSQLAPLYQQNSMLTFEGEKFLGTEKIMEKFSNGLKFTKAQIRFSTKDSQPSPGNGVLIFVCGEILADGEENPLRFSQIFNLQPVANKQGSYYINNDLFRLVYG